MLEPAKNTSKFPHAVAEASRLPESPRGPGGGGRAVPDQLHHGRLPAGHRLREPNAALSFDSCGGFLQRAESILVEVITCTRSSH